MTKKGVSIYGLSPVVGFDWNSTWSAACSVRRHEIETPILPMKIFSFVFFTLKISFWILTFILMGKWQKSEKNDLREK